MSTSAYPVHAPLQYVKAPRDGEELFVYKYELPQGIDKPSNLEIDEVDIDFTDLRTVEEPFDILRNGFQLERLEVPNDIDWDDDKDVRLSLTLTGLPPWWLQADQTVHAGCRYRRDTTHLWKNY